MLRATIFAKLPRAGLAEARDDFQYCVDQGYEDADWMRTWLQLEREHGQSYSNQLKITDLVINGKSYAEKVRYEFVARRSVATFFRAKDSGDSDAFDLFSEALKGHVRAFNFFWGAGADTNWNFKSVRNTGFALVSCAKQLDYDKQLVRVFRDIQRAEGVLCEPLFDPLRDVVRFLAAKRGGDVGRRREMLLLSIQRDLQSGAIGFSGAELTTRFLRIMEATRQRDAL